MDYVIRNARLFDRDGLLDIGFEKGRIAAIGHKLAAEAPSYDAGGKLVCPGLIETHIHLDKSRIADRCAPQPRATLSPVFSVTPVKKAMTVEDVHARAGETIKQCVLHGTTRMRTQLEVDPGIGMRGYEGVEAAIADYKHAIDVEICVFPQEGLISYPGTEELVIEGLKRGAKVLGGAPRYDKDPNGHVLRLFEIAREYDVDLDIHLDVGNTLDMNLYLVRELTDKFKWGGRVVAGHAAKLSLLPHDELAALARKLADSGVAVTVLPATDLYLMGRDRTHAVVRGVADAHFLCDHGVQCSLSSNNVLNPATPLGDCSLLRIANMYANVVQLDRQEQIAQCFNLLTDRSAKLMNLKDYGFAVGNPADVVVFNATSTLQAVAEIAQPVAAFKNGKQTMEWDLPRLLPH